jgi:predicted MFS family arabinose efflux permease
VALWASTALLNLALTIAELGLGLLVQSTTHSALLSTSVMVGPSLAQAVGGLTSMSVVDARPPRQVLSLTSASIAVLTAAQALTMPTSLRIALAFLTAYVLSISMGSRYGTLSGIVTQEDYSVARSAINIAVGVTQLLGYSIGAVLLHGLGIRTALLIAATLTAAACAALIALPALPARSDTAGGITQTLRVNRQLLRIPGARPLLLALVVPNGLIVGCEALFVAFNPTTGGAGSLFAASAAGMLLGDIIIGRLLGPRGRIHAAQLFRYLLAVPFLFFVLGPRLWVVTTLVVVATIGFGASLAQQEILNWLTPAEILGQTFGFESSMRTAGQGFFAIVAGALADLLDPAQAMLVLAVASLTTSLLLGHALKTVGQRYLRSITSPTYEVPTPRYSEVAAEES